MRNVGLDEAQAGVKIAGRDINNLRQVDDTIFTAESKEELKNLLMKVKEKREKAGLKLHTQKMKIMTSSPITSWQIDGEITETVSDFIFLGSKITADGDCSHEIKRCLLLGRKAVKNLDSILKSRDSTLPTKGCLVKASFSRIDAFELWCWRRLFRVPWIARRSTSQSQRKSVLGFHWKDWCWIWNSNTLATSCTDPDAGRDWGQEEKRMTEDEMAGWHHWLDGHEFEQAPGVDDGQGSLVVCNSWDCKESDTTEWLNWIELRAEPHSLWSRGESVHNDSSSPTHSTELPFSVSLPHVSRHHQCFLGPPPTTLLALKFCLEGLVSEENQSKTVQ